LSQVGRLNFYALGPCKRTIVIEECQSTAGVLDVKDQVSPPGPDHDLIHGSAGCNLQGGVERPFKGLRIA
jgi:hypothetical protein